ncbi:glycosyl transferase GTA-type super family [Candidatus Termititenax aidoneus]|uniref:Glycosyl transferase GTA-type super family n=1 Tax=Termititenax aidoneus TaxID=2218524 RepID=A0A388TCQ2_TERA1|nr:glycosyl transferase GTA-type super family [Candidatus Termititenax aidoneus]
MLGLTLDSFLAQDYPAGYEIIVVDNNSTDDTQQIIAEYLKYKNIKTFIEYRQGVHYARNSAAKIAQGNLLYYTDDDMLADKSLLRNLVQVFLENPIVASASGKILPKWEVEPPRWVKANLNNYLLSLNDLGDDTIIRDKDFCVYSCHQMIRADVFSSTGGFHPENTAGKWIGDGETGLNLEIQAQGYKFAYVGASVIWHMIPPARMTQEYLNKRLINQGNSDSYTNYRKYRYSQACLLGETLKHTYLGIKKFVYFVAYCLKHGCCKWETRATKAWTNYHIARVKYNLRLFFSYGLRQLVLKKSYHDD